MDCWLERRIQGKKILNKSLIDNEGHEFPIGSMVVEGEYLTLDGKSRSTNGHVFVDYRPSSVVYHFTNLIKHPSIDNVNEELNQGTLLLASFRAREIDGGN